MTIRLPRGRDRFGQHQESRPLATPDTESPRLTDALLSLINLNQPDWLKNEEWILCACSKIGTGQRSRFLVLTKRIAASGDENEKWPKNFLEFFLRPFVFFKNQSRSILSWNFWESLFSPSQRSKERRIEVRNKLHAWWTEENKWGAGEGAVFLM